MSAGGSGKDLQSITQYALWLRCSRDLRPVTLPTSMTRYFVCGRCQCRWQVSRPSGSAQPAQSHPPSGPNRFNARSIDSPRSVSVPDCTAKNSQPRHTGSWAGTLAPLSAPPPCDARRVQPGFTKGDSMGDKVGKKDKKKNQQQLATKQKHKEQKRLDKAPSRPLVVNTERHTAPKEL